MGIRTLKDVGSSYPIPQRVDASVYSLITEDCIIKGVGDEFNITYSDSSLEISFAKNSQAIIDGNAFWLEDSQKITLPDNSTVYVCLRIDTSKPNGSTGSIEILTQAEIKSDNLNNLGTAICDLPIYIITTNSNGVEKVIDKRTIRDGDIVKGVTGILPRVDVKTETDNIVVAVCGNERVSTVAEDNLATLYLTSKGTWTITDGVHDSRTIEVVDCGNYEVNFLATIYGISRDRNSSDPAWTRTDDSADFTFSASIGNTAGSSSFDDQPIYKDIKRVTLSTGDVMVQIPKFYYQRTVDDNGVEHIRIADNEVDGFIVHPAFTHNGTTQDYIYIGAYTTSSNNKSLSGATCTTNQTRATMRTNAKAKGTGWSLVDITSKNAVDTLILIEIANNNVQSLIGSGNCSTSGSIGTGKCDGVPNLTGRPSGTDTSVGVVWRGIENWWADLWEWVDGINFKDGVYYICNNQDSYADDTSNGYTALGYSGKTNWSSSYITEIGFDSNNPAIMLPTEAGSGGSNVFYCDGCWSSTGWRVFICGGYYGAGLLCGLFAASLNIASSSTNTSDSARLLKV